jgi:hypothetical protein
MMRSFKRRAAETELLQNHCRLLPVIGLHGGERGIRNLAGLTEGASYRFGIAATAKDTIVAMGRLSDVARRTYSGPH